MNHSLARVDRLTGKESSSDGRPPGGRNYLFNLKIAPAQTDAGAAAAVAPTNRRRQLSQSGRCPGTGEKAAQPADSSVQSHPPAGHVIFAFTIEDDRIVRIEIVADPERDRQLEAIILAD